MPEDPVAAAESEVRGATAAGATPNGPWGYELLHEIGRGGMGVVFRARDLALERDVAVKLLAERFPPDSLPAQRFVTEARITGQLQHPGIPAVHQVGTLADGRPFLAMKLIKGNTLETILKQRPDPTADRGRLLAIFEAACQAVGYAHAHRVIHRDLKPANVMVGAFGEVQVMDWGLAKALGEPAPVPGGAPAAEQTQAWTEIQSTPKSGSATQAGSLVGTPAYMPPEQALGEIEKVTERSDVFGLGALLTAILTGRPPYVGETTEAVRVQAVRGKLGDCFARLDASGAEPEVVALCKQCLAFEPSDRPADAGAVAQAITRLRAAADERARRAELERAAAAAEAREQAKRRRVQLALAACVVLLVAAAGAGAWFVQKQTADRERAEQAAREDAAVRAERARLGVQQALAQLPELHRRGLWDQAAGTLAKTETFLGPDGEPALKAQVEAAKASTAFLRRLDEIRAERADLGQGLSRPEPCGPKYAAAFRAVGFDPAAGDAGSLARWVNESPNRDEVLAALDDWSHFGGDPAQAKRLAGVTAAATGHGWREKLSDVWTDGRRLAAVYDAIPADQLTPAVITTVSEQLDRLGEDGVRRLAVGLRGYPGDFWLHFVMGYLRGANSREDRARRVGACRAALAVRPDNVLARINLGIMLFKQQDGEGALAVLREAVRRNPQSSIARFTLGAFLAQLNDPDGAVGVFREVIRDDPGYAPAYCGLGEALLLKDQLGPAAEALETALRLDPNHANSHNHLGRVRLAKRDPDGAIAAYRRAIECDAQFAWPHANLATVLMMKRDFDGAAAEYREALRLDPTHTQAHNNLVAALALSGRPAEGLRHAVTALARDPRLDDNPQHSLRFNGACCAMNCANGKGKAVVPPADRPAFRKQALDLLTAELARLRTFAATDQVLVRRKLQEWLADGDFASVRGPEAIDKLPPDEQAGWRNLWTDVTSFLKQAEDRSEGTS